MIPSWPCYTLIIWSSGWNSTAKNSYRKTTLSDYNNTVPYCTFDISNDNSDDTNDENTHIADCTRSNIYTMLILILTVINTSNDDTAWI